MCGLYACIDMCVEVACMCTMHKYTNEGAMVPKHKKEQLCMQTPAYLHKCRKLHEDAIGWSLPELAASVADGQRVRA